MRATLRCGGVAARPDTDELVRRALAYPYDPPAGSFVQIGDRTLPVPPEEIDVEGRRALLAYGANASPEALTRKLAAPAAAADPGAARRARAAGTSSTPPTSPATARCPAAVVASPGTVASVHLVFPDDEQLAALAATEGQNYRLERLTDFSAELEIEARGAARDRRLHQRPRPAAPRRLTGRPRRDPRPRPRLPRADHAGDDRPRPRRAPPRADPARVRPPPRRTRRRLRRWPQRRIELDAGEAAQGERARSAP